VVGDFGTAATIDCVNAEGVFLGGAILPGAEIAPSLMRAV
jgi:pantothenate kinase type III